MGTDVRVRRVYDQSSPEDGARVLVDRVWPRGMRKEAARLEEILVVNSGSCGEVEFEAG